MSPLPAHRRAVKKLTRLTPETLTVKPRIGRASSQNRKLVSSSQAVFAPDQKVTEVRHQSTLILPPNEA
jgi:hypothetical protein